MFQVFNIVIQHLYTYWSDHYNKSSNHIIDYIPYAEYYLHLSLLIAPLTLQAHVWLTPFPGIIFPHMSFIMKWCSRMPFIRSICPRYLKFILRLIYKSWKQSRER